MLRLKGKRIAMIIAKSNFRDEEFLKPKEVLENDGADIIVVSSQLETAVGRFGAKVKPNILLDDVKVNDYDALLFIGGSGAQEYWDNSKAHEIVNESVKSDRVIGAICIGPVILGNAGILKNKRATVFDSEISRIEDKGAIFTGADVEIDGKIVTANGPHAAEKFGKAISDLLSK